MTQYKASFIIYFLVTVGGIGHIRIAPGTFGALVAIPIFYGVLYFAVFAKLIFSIVAILLLLTLALFILGWVCTDIYVANTNNVEDPSEVVIDEVVGQLLTIILCYPLIILLTQDPVMAQWQHYSEYMEYILLIPSVLLFRFFDIVKPWPIGWLDANIRGGFGVMLDDVVAAIFASIMFWAIGLVCFDIIAPTIQSTAIIN